MFALGIQCALENPLKNLVCCFRSDLGGWNRRPLNKKILHFDWCFRLNNAAPGYLSQDTNFLKTTQN